MFKDIVLSLSSRYAPGEARAMAFILLEDGFGIPRIDVYTDKVRKFSEEELSRLENILHRLQEGEPLQYVLETAVFCGLSFKVTPATLIPRPETEELVEWAGSPAGDILDAGTGTGCIAITLALRNPQARVTAWDISPEALEIAAQNARRHQANVRLEHRDLLSYLPAPKSLDLIISNPPYICEREKMEMESVVLDHEPATALFVPDEDPLLFYRALARLGQHALRPGGIILMEINRAYGKETLALFQNGYYTAATLRNDDFGNARMVRAVRTSLP